MLKEVPKEAMSAIALHGGRVGLGNVQLPGAVTELGTGLADVEVADLQGALLAFGHLIAMQHMIVMKLKPWAFNATL